MDKNEIKAGRSFQPTLRRSGWYENDLTEMVVSFTQDDAAKEKKAAE